MSVRLFSVLVCAQLLGCSSSEKPTPGAAGPQGGGGPAGGGGGAGGSGAQASGGAGQSSAGSPSGGSPSSGGSLGEAGAPSTPVSCDDLGSAPIVRSFTPKRFALGDDPSADPECTLVLNPERGFRSTSNLRSAPDFSGTRADGFSTVYGAILIDDYVDQDLDQGLLDELAQTFAAARAEGVKLLPRFYYQANLD